MAYEFATYEKKGRIAVVTVNRPERMNALHPPANFEFDRSGTTSSAIRTCGSASSPAPATRRSPPGNDLRFTASTAAT